MRIRLVAGLAALALVTLSGCGNSGGAEGGQAVALKIMAPASPGGGWDTTSRTAQQAFESIGQKSEVFNVPGAGGTIGLAQLANEKGNGNMLMTMGLVMVGAVETNKSKITLENVTPIAKLTEEYEIVVVPAQSPYQTLQDLVTAWKADPAKIAIAGGSAGGTDHIVAGLLAKAAGIDPKQVNYIAHSGGGEALNALLGNTVAVGISGVSEFAEHVKSGKLRALGVTSPKPVDGLNAPTIKDGGLDVVLANWRGFVAPPELSEDAKKSLTDLVRKMHDSQAWKDAVTKNGWIDTFQTDQAFVDYLASERTRIKGIIAEMGLGT
ncbi:Bug family tripartite tricarboxylate transporter substrate binding protein [Rhizohabitans arisaemae]|uniref:Bug family tripartite tricarboxylate transporter substrate binding protein n=1 Tax=Rhizohabitans arisaemae TaxID=2720610 RepID=UPI0024B06381|nr:tripartite tricarboxylate transporter substrate-binding protein [Rhizohabitans arisaemae]